MRLLVIDTASEACSLALFDDRTCIASSHEVLGRGHAERLIPTIAAMPAKGQADRIAVSLGPGSFTGTRIGLAAARALGVARQVDVIGYPTLAIVAAVARAQFGTIAVSVAMAGGHGEIFVQNFDAAGMPSSAPVSLTPEAAAKAASANLVAGNKAEDVVTARTFGTAMPALPDARAFLGIPAPLFTNHLAPIYGRPPDAKPS